MNVTLNWLKNYIDFELSPSELADRLTMLGIEVESVKQLGAELEGVVVGSVGSIKPHPNADKLVLCQVDTGETENFRLFVARRMSEKVCLHRLPPSVQRCPSV